MNKQGQIGIGSLVVVAVAIILGLVLLQSSAQNIGGVIPSSTTAANNVTYTTGANGAIIELVGQELVGTPIVTNSTNSSKIVEAANYTIAECVRASDSLKGICYTTNTVSYQSTPVNISYNYYPAGYADDAGSRSIIGIIILLAAVAIALIALPNFKGVLD